MSDTQAPTVNFNPFSPEFRDDPYPSYRTKRDAGPVIRTPFGLLMVTRYEPVDRILRVGAALARAEAKAAFERLVAQTRELAVAERPEWRPGINLRALTSLPIALAS
jgi:cytochrome P450